MFLVNSRLDRFSAAPSCFSSKYLHTNGATLLPKLRVQIAEFLNVGSLARLRILSSPTCVGLRYGHSQHTAWLFWAVQVSPLRTKSSRPPLIEAVSHIASRLTTRRTTTGNCCKWGRNINRLSIAYAFQPRLRPA